MSVHVICGKDPAVRDSWQVRVRRVEGSYVELVSSDFMALYKLVLNSNFNVDAGASKSIF